MASMSVVLRLHLMVLRAFSNLNDSVFLRDVFG